MLKPFKITLILAVFFFGSCVSTHVAKIHDNATAVEVFTTKIPDREYIEMSYITADGSAFHNPHRLIKKLAERAKKEGADAVIDVKISYQGYIPVASGTAIKYKEKKTN